MSLKKRPLVTVITLSYKKYDYIYDTIESVLLQDYPNIQYIISDDGAANFPYEEIEQYVNNNARDNINSFFLITRQENVGTVKNLNQAVAKAEGEYIIHLSADDVFCDSNVVSKVVDAFQTKQCDVIGTLRIFCDEKLNPIRYMPSKFYQRRIKKWDTAQKQYDAFVSGRFYEMASGSVLNYKKSYWEKHPFDESYVLWEDGPFIECYLRKGNFLYVDYSFPAIYYRKGGISTGGNINPLLKKDTKLLESVIASYFAERNNTSWISRYVKFFFLAPIKFYYAMEKRIVYRMEAFLVRNGLMKI